MAAPDKPNATMQVCLASYPGLAVTILLPRHNQEVERDTPKAQQKVITR